MRAGCCRILRPNLVPAAGVVSPNADLDRIAGRPVLIDLGFAGELEARLLQVVRADVHVALRAIVPEERGFVDPTRNRQADLAVALAGRGRLEIGDAFFQIRAAVSSEVCRLGGHAAQHNSADCEDGCPSRPNYTPTHTQTPTEVRFNSASIYATNSITRSCRRAPPNSSAPARRPLAFAKKCVNADSAYDNL